MATRLDFDGLDAIVKDLNKMNQLLESSMIDDALEEAIQPAYKDAIKRVSRLFINEPLILEVEPGNLQDMNAVKVLTEDKVHIGYLPKDIPSS